MDIEAYRTSYLLSALRRHRTKPMRLLTTPRNSRYKTSHLEVHQPIIFQRDQQHRVGKHPRHLRHDPGKVAQSLVLVWESNTESTIVAPRASVTVAILVLQLWKGRGWGVWMFSRSWPLTRFHVSNVRLFSQMPWGQEYCAWQSMRRNAGWIGFWVVHIP